MMADALLVVHFLIVAFIVGGLLLVVELIAPGTFMLWLGLSALLVGVISLLVEWPWQSRVPGRDHSGP